MNLHLLNPFLRYISAFRYVASKGEVIALDAHLNYIQSGRVFIRLGDTVHALPRDTLFYCPRSTVYEYIVDKTAETPCVMTSLNFDLTQREHTDTLPRTPPNYDPAMTYPEETELPLIAEDDSFLSAPHIFYHAQTYNPYIARILNEFRLDHRFSRELCSCILKELLVLLHSAPQNTYPSKQKTVEHLVAYIESNLSTSLDNRTLAELSGYHPNYVSRLFQQYLHMSPHQYILMLRIAQAKKLISETDLPFDEIASRIGFQDYPYFSAYFKKKTGMSPANYRKQIQTIT